jgi:hypothetical protein
VAEFLAALLEFESGISTSRFEWYCRNYDSPVMRYVMVKAPGRLIRHERTGDPMFRIMSVREYFQALGVVDWFDPSNPHCVRSMQYRSKNGWGFVGYQLGEAILISNGYYQPEQVEVVLGDGTPATVGSWYLGHIGAEMWADGRHVRLDADPHSGAAVLATDVNCWRGSFTGLDGVWSFEDLLIPERQDAVVRRTLRNGLRDVHKAMQRASVVSGGAPDRIFTFQGRRFLCSESGIAAALHLRGSDAVIELLLEDVVSSDELGTSILSYMDKFGGYSLRGL